MSQHASSHFVPTTLSKEQQAIVDSFATHNLVVNAVAGSGKTTTILSVAQLYPQKSFLMLTYNTRLCSETQERVRARALSNLQVFTYHSFMTAMCGTTVSTDLLLKKSLDYHFIQSLSFDALIVDESQDMTPDLFHVVLRARNECLAADASIVLLGDSKQCIFSFKEASPVFLTSAEHIFGPLFYKPWKHLSLSESFRCPPAVCRLVNSLFDHEFMRPGTDKPGRTELVALNPLSNDCINIAF